MVGVEPFFFFFPRERKGGQKYLFAWAELVHAVMLLEDQFKNQE